MTGIERLRKLSEDMLSFSLWVRLTTGTEKDWDCYQGDGRTVNDELLSIADQIEREREQESIALFDARVGEEIDICELFGIEPGDDPLTALRRHIEGQDDTIENLRIELGECDVSAAWVRDHGGFDYVMHEWQSRVPHDLYERRRQSLLGHIAECETALRRRNVRIEELGHRVDDLTRENAELRKRAMPEGMQWPRYESGELVQTGATFAEKGTIKNVVASVELSDDWFAVHGFDGAIDKYSKGERVKRPAPAVLAADGEPLEVGQTVWDTNGDELVIGAIEDGGHTVTCRYADVGDGIPAHGMWSPSDLTHQRPVLDADGVPIKVGDTVYFTDGREQECNTVVHAKYDYKDEPYVQLGRLNEAGYPTYTNCSCIDPSQLTHTKPEIDSWERVEEDKDLNPFDHCKKVGHKLWTFDNAEEFKASDLVRRAKKLAGVDND